MNLTPWLILVVIAIIGLLLVERYGQHGVSTRRRVAAGLATIGLTTLWGAEVSILTTFYGISMLNAAFFGSVVGLIGGIIIVVAGSAHAGWRWSNEAKFDKVLRNIVLLAVAVIVAGVNLVNDAVWWNNSQNASQHASNSYSYRINRNYADALAEINQAVQLDPQRADYYDQRTEIYESMGDLKRAIADLEKALALGLDPEDRQAVKALLETLKR